MSKINCNNQPSATVVNKQKLVNGKWKIFCATLILLYVSNTMAGNPSSQNKNSEYSNENIYFNESNLRETPLIAAIIDAGMEWIKNKRTEKIKHIKLLLEKGNNPNGMNQSRETPLMLAAQYNLVEIVELLLSKYKAKVDQTQQTGDTALMYAFRANLEEKDTNQLLKTIQLLIQYGADLNQKNEKGQTALMFAAQEGHTKVLKFMLSREITDPVKDLLIRGKTKRKTTNSYIEEKSLEIESKSQIRNINIQDNFGRTALMYATDPETVNVLLAHGADITIKDNDGNTAIDYAELDENEEVINILENQLQTIKRNPSSAQSFQRDRTLR